MHGLPAQPLYDAQRDVYYVKPVWRGWLHLLWFAASLIACPLLVAHGHGASPTAALAIYALSVSGLFGVSALYHRGTWTPAWSRRLQRLDHLMIFFLIAGTATPVFLIAARGAFGMTCLIVMWVLTLAAVAIHLAWMNAPELLVGGTFVGLGSLAAIAMPAVWAQAGVRAGLLTLGRRPALHNRRALVPPAQARPFAGGVRLPRGLPRLRLRRRQLPVPRDRARHRPAWRLRQRVGASGMVRSRSPWR